MILTGVLVNFNCNIFNSIKYSPALEATCRLAVEDIPGILRISKVYYRIHKTKSLVLVLSHITPVNTALTIFFRAPFNIILHLRLGFPVGVLTAGISIQLCMCVTSGTRVFYVPSVSPSPWWF